MSKAYSERKSLTSFSFLKWILQKKKYKCPRCNYPVLTKSNYCEHCGQPFS